MKPNKQTTIQTLLALGKGQREIARATGIDRKTIRRYAGQAVPANSPGVVTGSPEQIPPPRPPAHTSACEPWREFIGAQLELKRNAMAIYQDLVDVHGFAHGYNSVKRFVARLCAREPEQFDRLEFAPGEEAQVDYGEGALTWDAVSRRYKRPRLFVMTLRYSRRSFRRVVWKSGQQEWARLHEQAFRYFGGAPGYVVLDNLKEGVIKPDLYEPELNAVYAALLAHYRCVADPARVRDPIVIKQLAVHLADQATFPDLVGWADEADKVASAKSAVLALKTYIDRERSKTEVEAARTAIREEAAKQRAEKVASQLDLAKLQTQLTELHPQAGTQAGGYAFEKWFYDFVKFFDVDHRRPYKADERQIDGSVTIEGTTYLVELKFTSNQTGVEDVDSFLVKVNNKADNTMGLFVSMAGYSSVAISQASKPRTPLLLMDASHVFLALQGLWEFPELVSRLRQHASQTSEAYFAAQKLSR